MKKGKVLLGVLIGTTAGALMGLLFAPQKGQDTRKDISKTSKKYADSLKEEFKETLDEVKKKFRKAKDEVYDLAHQAKMKEARLKKEFGIENS